MVSGGIQKTVLFGLLFFFSFFPFCFSNDVCHQGHPGWISNLKKLIHPVEGAGYAVLSLESTLRPDFGETLYEPLRALTGARSLLPFVSNSYYYNRMVVFRVTEYMHEFERWGEEFREHGVDVMNLIEITKLWIRIMASYSSRILGVSVSQVGVEFRVEEDIPSGISNVDYAESFHVDGGGFRVILNLLGQGTLWQPGGVLWVKAPPNSRDPNFNLAIISHHRLYGNTQLPEISLPVNHALVFFGHDVIANTDLGQAKLLIHRRPHTSQKRLMWVLNGYF